MKEKNESIPYKIAFGKEVDKYSAQEKAEAIKFVMQEQFKAVAKDYNKDKSVHPHPLN